MKRIHPNYITSLRAFLFGPLALICLMQGSLKLALVFMILGELTDFFDGMHARRTNQISNLGKVFDPMCDSIFHMTIWIGFLAIGWISVFFVVLFFARDSVVSTIRTYMASHNIVLAARWSGKIKMATQSLVQTVLVVLHLISISENALYCTQLIMVSLAATVTVISLCDYCLHFFYAVKEKRITNCKIQRMATEGLTFPDGSFDIITCIEVLEHVQNQDRALYQISRILKPNGVFVLSVPNRWWIFETHGAKLPLFKWNRVPFFSWLPKKIHNRYAYARIYTLEEITNLLHKHGFEIKKVVYFMPPLDKLESGFVKDVFKNFFLYLSKTSLKIFGVSIFLFCIKNKSRAIK